MSIATKHCQTLELHKVLEKLSELACCEAAKEQILAITPSTDLQVVKEQLQMTHMAYVLSGKYGNPRFMNLSDPTSALQLCKIGGTLSLRAFLNIAHLLSQVRSLKSWARQCERDSEAQPLLELFALLQTADALERRIEQVVQTEDLVHDHASPALNSIRQKIRRAQAKAKQSIENITHSNQYQKILQESIVTIRDGRYVIPVKAEYRNDVPGLVHDTSSSGATLFIEPMAAVQANNEIKVLLAEEKKEIDRILQELSGECAEYADLLKQDFALFLELHIYLVKSDFAASMKASLPEVTNDGTTILRKARHPLLDPKKVVPIDVVLGKSYRLLVVTGPNTGGKTVTLKTIGLFTLMAMCGLMLPVGDGSVVSVFDRILVDIGDEQSIEQNLSTFSAHMTNIISILKDMSRHSLVLMDELGSGTDPVEGAALAIAILEKLKERGCVVAATTHYPELKTYAIETEGVENASCEFDVQTLQPTYRLLIGTPGRSNAFAISKRLGMQEDVLQHAASLVSKNSQQLENVIGRLEGSRQDFEKQKQEYEDRLKKLRTLEKLVQGQKQKVDQEKEKILERANLQAQTMLAQIKAESQSIMDELDELRKQKEQEDFSQKVAQTKQQLRKRTDRMYQHAHPVRERQREHYKLPRALKVGDVVQVYDLDKQGVVVELAEKQSQAVVQVGMMKMRVDMDNLRLTEGKQIYQAPRGKITRTMTQAASRKAETELDLRGQSVEDALMELDFFLDKGALSNLEQLTIIHGKGTGALRAAIHTYLKKNKRIRSYRLGTFGEGEAGVTIVQLK